MSDVAYWTASSAAFPAVLLPSRGAPMRLVIWNVALLVNVLGAAAPGINLEAVAIALRAAITLDGATRLVLSWRRGDVEGVPR